MNQIIRHRIICIAVLKKGVPVYGMQGVGDDFTSEGSEWIIKELQVNDDRPLWISVWGGANVLAQALYDIQKRFSELRQMN